MLKFDKQDQYCRFRAQGLTQAQAAIQAGYSATHAASIGCKLERRPSVKARIAELSATVDPAITKSAILSKAGVLEGITETIKEAREEKRFGDAMRGYELLGKHYGLFDRDAKSLGWNGDPSTLTDDQLEAMSSYFMQIAYNGDQKKIEAARKRAMIEAGQAGPIVDATSTPAAPEEEKEQW